MGTEFVGLLNSTELSPDRYASCLNPAELAESSAISNQQRKAEWLAGRIAAKFVFLHRDGSESGELRLQEITGSMLDVFAPSTYRDVLVSRDKSPGGGPARIAWRSGGPARNVAISHVYGLACAFIGSTDVYAVDLETATARIPEFYAQNFTARERIWTAECHWLYTLLWSAKECLLKTPAFRALSLWDMPSMEITILSGIESLRAIQDTTNFSGNFAFLEAEVTPAERIQSRCPAKRFRLAVSGTADLVITAITRLD